MFLAAVSTSSYTCAGEPWYGTVVGNALVSVPCIRLYPSAAAGVDTVGVPLLAFLVLSSLIMAAGGV